MSKDNGNKDGKSKQDSKETCAKNGHKWSGTYFGPEPGLKPYQLCERPGCGERRDA